MKKKHHYIQRAFISNFSINSRTYSFDKIKNEVRNNNIKDVFEENNFYRIPLKKYYDLMSEEEQIKINEVVIEMFNKRFEELKEEEKNQVEEWFEDFFAKGVEPTFLNTVKELRINIGDVIIGKRINPITTEIRYKLSTCLAFFYSRTRYFRDSLIKSLKNFYKQTTLIKAQFLGISIKENDFDISFGEERSRMEHIQFLSGVMENDSMIEAIFTRKWSFIINTSNSPFVLADNIFSIKLTMPLPEFYGVGLKSVGAEIYFPISPQLMLVLNDPIVFDYIKNGSCYLIKEENEINNINSFIINQCYKNSVSIDGDYLIKLTGAKKNFK